MTSTSMSTRGNPSRTINWLFFNPANARSTVWDTTIPGHALDTSVGNLEWVASLKGLFKFRTDKANVEFWTPSTPLNMSDVGVDWIKDHPDINKVARRCQPAFPLSELLDQSWDRKYVHFFITAKEAVEDTGLAKDAEERDRVSEFPLQMMHRRFREGQVKFPAPSTAATSKEYAKLQKNSKTAIYDGFYVSKEGPHPTVITIAPPVQIFHPVFQEFLDRIDDPTFKPDKEVVSCVSELMLSTTEIRPSEDHALGKLRPLLTRLLGAYVGQAISTGTRTPDGVVCKTLDTCLAPLLCFEYKRALGEGGCDPSTQAAYSLREFLVKDDFESVLKKCCCPSFLLAGDGPHLSILGVVYTDKFVVQQLTELWVGVATTHQQARVDHLARVFGSLRLAVAALDEYYGRVSGDPDVPTLVLNKPHPRFFPHPTRFKEYRAEADAKAEWTEFEYIDVPRADPTNVTFVAEVKSSDRKLVIKFVERYGVEAHQLLADAGMAPRLLYCGLLDGECDVRSAGGCTRVNTATSGLHACPVDMVVMEYVEGDTVDKAPVTPKDTREKAEKAIQKLHDAQLVFGDLRAVNVMVSGDKVFLIDFDWAGKVNEARYPLNLSRSVKWPKEAEKLEMEYILMDHDWFMLDQLFPK